MLATLMKRLLDASHQQAIIPIEGQGSSGKSRFAAEVAWRVVKGGAGRGYATVVWVASTTTPSDATPIPAGSLAGRLVSTLGQVYNLQAIPPDGGLSLGRAGCEDLLKQCLQVAGPTLVFLDGLDDPHAPSVRELLAFTDSLGTGHKVVVTSRGGRRWDRQFRIPPLDDAEMEVVIAQECGWRGVQLDEAQLRAVRARARGLPAFACEVTEQMKATSVSAVMAQLDRLWAAFARRTFDGLSRRLQSECLESHRLLCTLARDPAFHGARVVGLREIARCAGSDPDACEPLLDPLLVWNLIVREGSWNYVMPPAVRAYFAQVASTTP